jgi:hypothetical protein
MAFAFGLVLDLGWMKSNLPICDCDRRRYGEASCRTATSKSQRDDLERT